LDLWEFGFSQSTPPSAISTDELERRAPDAVSLPEVSIVNCEVNFSNFEFFTMMAAQMNGGASRLTHDDDSDDEMLATTLVEAMQEDEGDYDDVGSISGIQVTGDDLQARLAAAATPLEFQAGLPARFTSYDNYCSLFHFILNSDGPVDLELPTVSAWGRCLGRCCEGRTELSTDYMRGIVLLGLGCHR
jgi:hypothetical protein